MYFDIKFIKMQKKLILWWKFSTIKLQYTNSKMQTNCFVNLYKLL